MEYKRLEQSLIDIVKEEQAKLGYRKEVQLTSCRIEEFSVKVQ